MEVLDGTEVARAVDATGSMHEVGDGIGAGADAKTRVDAGAGLETGAADEMGGGSDWYELVGHG